MVEVLVVAADDAVVPQAVVAFVVAVLADFELERHAARRHMAAIPANVTFGLSNVITLCSPCRQEAGRAAQSMAPGSSSMNFATESRQHLAGE
jgi:hypothetical protein